MKTGWDWDVFDTQDDDNSPVAAWAELIVVVLFVLMTLTRIFLGF